MQSRNNSICQKRYKSYSHTSSFLDFLHCRNLVSIIESFKLTNSVRMFINVGRKVGVISCVHQGGTLTPKPPEKFKFLWITHVKITNDIPWNPPPPQANSNDSQTPLENFSGSMHGIMTFIYAQACEYFALDWLQKTTPLRSKVSWRSMQPWDRVWTCQRMLLIRMETLWQWLVQTETPQGPEQPTYLTSIPLQPSTSKSGTLHQTEVLITKCAFSAFMGC